MSSAQHGNQHFLVQALERHQAGDLAQAIALYRRQLELTPNHAGSWANLGIALKFQGDLASALEACQRACQLDDSNPNAHNNLGIVLLAMGRTEQAITAYRRALERDPRFHECWTNLGLAHATKGDPAASVEALRKALAIKPDHTEALAQFIYRSLQIGEWRELDRAIARLAQVIRTDAGEVNPFIMLPICRDPMEVLRVSRNFARRVEASVASLPRPKLKPRSKEPRRPRIGYLSSDLHLHATAYLAAEMFESHDRSRFEIFAYSYGADDQSDMRQRLQKGFEHFVDILPLSIEGSAQRIADDEIDILVDLKGYTQGARHGILALRPAPIQVAYLGFPGPMGADFIDYSIVDDFIAPPGYEQFYTEKLIRIPGSYQCNDSARYVAPAAGTRRDHHLPEDGFVFCCFNQPYKITPEIFRVWLKLLMDVPGSVLWLLAFNPTVSVNLRQLAKVSGIDPERLVFADKWPLDRHLARLQLADLFLDTWPCNAHTTASDALWAGVPVVTYVGRTFAQRVAGSLLTALDLQELIADSIEAYYALALRLARDRRALSELKSKLVSARSTSDLFDGKAAARKLEAAFELMLQERQ